VVGVLTTATGGVLGVVGGMLGVGGMLAIRGLVPVIAIETTAAGCAKSKQATSRHGHQCLFESLHKNPPSFPLCGVTGLGATPQANALMGEQQ
jgi:hypothetical protein